MTVGKNASKLTPHQRMRQFPNRRQWQCVVDVIVHCRAPIRAFQAVPVPPDSKRSRDLFVDEVTRRLPVTDEGLPAKTNPPQPEAVADMGTFADARARGCNDREVEFRGRDALEVSRIRKKRKQILRRLRQSDCGIKAVLHWNLVRPEG